MRELRNVVEHLVVMATAGKEIAADEIHFIDEPREPKSFRSGFDDSVMSMGYHTAREVVLSQFEVEYLQHIVTQSRGNISDAARRGRRRSNDALPAHGEARDGARIPLRGSEGTESR